MTNSPSWRLRAATVFGCEKQPATGQGGVVAANHPLAAAAGAEMLAAGGNAIDAAIATLAALTVVEPMMVGLLGGGMAHIRLANGQHLVIDGMSVVPRAGHATMFEKLPGSAHDAFDVVGRHNLVGALAIATPGAVLGWYAALTRFGTMTWDDVLQPAIRLAARGFIVSPYLHECIKEAAADLAADPAAAALYVPNGLALAAGARLIQSDYAETLRALASEGPALLHGGALGGIVADHIARQGGILSLADLAGYQTRDRAPIRGSYRGWEILGPPPPAASGVHIVQMLNILEGYDIAGLGFGSAASVHLLAEALKIAFADRAAATADPDFVDVPVARLISKDYAGERRAALSQDHAQAWGAGVATSSPHTTHTTVADRFGNVVASTQTINSLFGARLMVPGTGMLANNYMALFDPRPGPALSVAPGKRVTTSMAPVMALQDGRLRVALGLPGGKRIFPSVLQALINLIDHGMTVQEAVEAPRVWTEGNALEVEEAFPTPVLRALRGMGHVVQPMPHVAGGMNAIRFNDDGSMTGAACWRADGTVLALGGGAARGNVRFWPDQAAPDRAEIA